MKLVDSNIREVEDIRSFLVGKGYVAIPIRQNIAGHLVVETRINGIPCLCFLDTGAGETVVDSKWVDHLNMKANEEDMSLTGAGAGGREEREISYRLENM